MDQAKAEQIVSELQCITRIIYTGQIMELKPSATLLEKRIKPSDALPFIKKDAPGHALYYIVEGKAGVDVGQLEKIVIPPQKTVGEMSMVSTILNAFDDMGTLESRTADVYAQEPMRLIVFNYSPLVEILKEKNPEFRKHRHQILINMNRIMFLKLMDVNHNFINILTNYGLSQEIQVAKYPLQLTEGMSRFFKKLRTIPNMSVSPHELRGVIIREGEPNDSMIFLENGKVKVTMMVKKLAPIEENRDEIIEFIPLDLLEAPMMVGESAILNIGSIAGAQVETLGKVVGFRMQVQKLLRHLQHYPDMFEEFFLLLLELNYFRTIKVMQKTTNL